MSGESLALPGDEIEDLAPAPPTFKAPASTSNPAVERMADDYRLQLQKFDDAKGTNLTRLFNESLSMHNEQEMLRQNLAQVQVMMQEQMIGWVTVRTELQKKIETLDPTKKGYTASMTEIVRLYEMTNDGVRKTAKVIRDLKKEIRLTETSDRYHFHVSVVIQFLTALTALLFRELHSHPKLDSIASGIKDLSKMFRLQSDGDS